MLRAGITLAAAATIAAATLATGARVGAAEDWAPAAGGYVDLLATPYEGVPGRGASLHATCAPDGQGVEIGVHPFDEVPRNFQVWDTSPPAPMMLDNVTEADWSAVYPFGWLAVLYAGTARYDLVAPDVQRSLCTTPPPTPETPETSTPTVPPVASSAPPTTGPPPSTAQTVVSTPEHSPPPGVETTTTAGVLIATQPRQQLPATGDRTGPAIVLAGALLAVGALAWAAGRHLGRISDTYPPADNEDGQP